jgi:hypothetical protein
VGALSDTLKPKYNGCRFGELIETHADEDDRNVIEDLDVTNAAIAAFVWEHWGQVGRTTISEHRRHVCACYKTDGAA